MTSVRNFQGGRHTFSAGSFCIEFVGGELPRGADVEVVEFKDETAAMAALAEMGGEATTWTRPGEKPVPCKILDTAPNNVDTWRAEVRPSEYYGKPIFNWLDFAVRVEG